MIQRIQTLYLFVSLLLTGTLFFLPIADFILGKESYSLYFDGIKAHKPGSTITEVTTYPLIILLSIIALLNFISIFLYKKRIAQMRICIYNILLMIGLVILIIFYIFKIAGDIEATINYKITAILPLISIILTYLASRAIRKDEKLIRSLDRIR